VFRLHTITLTQFKNYTSAAFAFDKRIIGICGDNGVGKTNLLDAIYYLCFTKSNFIKQDQVHVNLGSRGFRISGNFDLNGQAEEAVCIFRETGKKEFSVNGRVYEKLSQHIGHYPCVMIAPDDIQVIANGSDERRRFLDTLLSQLDRDYLQQLVTYNRLLTQRNSLLKNFSETGRQDLSLMDVLDRQLLAPGTEIFTKRKEFLVSFIPEISIHYRRIANRDEEIGCEYLSDLNHQSMEELLKQRRRRDLIMQRTTGGIHRDDLEFTFRKQPFKTQASQGQRKSLLFSLKLAELNVLRIRKGFTPLLLLDDVFEKLDEGRIENLLNRVCLENDGQVFITDTDPGRLERHLESFSIDYQLITLEPNGG